MGRLVLLYFVGSAIWVVAVIAVGALMRYRNYRKAVEEWVDSESGRAPRGEDFFRNFDDFVFPWAIPVGLVWPLALIGGAVFYPSRGLIRKLKWWFSEGAFQRIDKKVLSKKKAVALTSPNKQVREKAEQLLSGRNKRD